MTKIPKVTLAEHFANARYLREFDVYEFDDGSVCTITQNPFPTFLAWAEYEYGDLRGDWPKEAIEKAFPKEGY